MPLQLTGCSKLTPQVGTKCKDFYSAGPASEDYAIKDAMKDASGIGHSILESEVTNHLILC